MMLRRGTGGYYVNGVVARWPSVQGTLDLGANSIVEGTETTLAELFVSAPSTPTGASQLNWTPATARRSRRVERAPSPARSRPRAGPS
jgi:hypothetical protein